MALDRQSIEKRDFPIGRRGYEPEAVDEHLSRLANEVDQLKQRSEKRSPESLAAVASQQVASIVQAAEETAADLERQANEEADRIRREAQADAQQTRDEAVNRSQSHLQKVGDSTSQMLQRVDAMQSELQTMVDSLRTGGNRLQADLSLLEGSMRELYDTGGRRIEAVAAEAQIREVPAPAAEPEPEAAAEIAAVEVFAVEVAADDEDAPDLVTDEPAFQPEAAVVAGRGADTDEDIEGARLIALNMALNGTARDETDRYLAEHFELSDRSSLLDEVYESVE